MAEVGNDAQNFITILRNSNVIQTENRSHRHCIRLNNYISQRSHCIAPHFIAALDRSAGYCSRLAAYPMEDCYIKICALKGLFTRIAQSLNTSATLHNVQVRFRAHFILAERRRRPPSFHPLLPLGMLMKTNICVFSATLNIF